MNATIRCALALAVASVASGCATTMPREVKVPVAIRCEIYMPAEPAWSTKNLKPDAGIFEQAKALLAERQQARGYHDELKSALQECADEIDIEAPDVESAEEAALLD